MLSNARYTKWIIAQHAFTFLPPNPRIYKSPHFRTKVKQKNPEKYKKINVTPKFLDLIVLFAVVSMSVTKYILT